MNAIKTIGKVATIPKISFLASNTIICRMIIVNEEDTFPIICFNSFAIKVTELCKKNAQIKIEGNLKDYSYLDNNNTIHYIKVLLSNKVVIDKNEIIEKNEEKNDQLWYSIKNHYQVLDILDFERIIRNEESKNCYL